MQQHAITASATGYTNIFANALVLVKRMQKYGQRALKARESFVEKIEGLIKFKRLLMLLATCVARCCMTVAGGGTEQNEYVMCHNK